MKYTPVVCSLHDRDANTFARHPNILIMNEKQYTLSIKLNSDQFVSENHQEKVRYRPKIQVIH